MDKKLIEVVRELNVGMDTLVDFLTDKGFPIERKPIAKVTGDMYDTLIKKFSDSKSEKQKADQIVIGTRPIQSQPLGQPQQQRPVTPSVNLPPIGQRPNLSSNGQTTTVREDRPKPDITERARVEVNITNKFDISPKKQEPAKVDLKPSVPTPVSEPKVAVEQKIIVEQKVDVKIDNTTTPQTAKPEIRTPQQNTPQRQNPTTQQPRDNKDNRGNNERRPDNNNRGGNNERRPDSNTGGNNNRQDNRGGGNRDNNNIRSGNNDRRPDNRQGGRSDNRSDNRVLQDKKTQYEPYKQPPPEPERIYVNEPVEGEDRPELIKAEAPQLRGLKIKGKIDVDKFIEKEKEVSRSNSNNNGRDRNRRGGRGRDDRRPGDRPVDGAAVKPVSTEGGLKPTTTGGATTESEAAKRRRKRKKIPTGNTPQTNQTTDNRNNNSNNNNSNTQNNNNNHNRPDNRGGFNRPDNRNTGSSNNAPPRRDQQPAEISQQQIEQKIKETMARLNMGGQRKGQKVRRDKRVRMREKEEMRQAEMETGKLQVAEFISVSDLASLMDISATEIIKTCMGLGIFVSINQRLDAELIEVIASEFNQEVEFISAEEQVSVTEEEPDSPEDLVARAPVVTIMGHVDHGKTSLLDHVRKTDVASGEAGGITQHIGAYNVKLADGRRITFLDTPGHEAFTAMRARGAKVTDVAVVIIAADDNIMPQTREAISHAQAAGVPIVFAINKIDKPGADPERIKAELAQMNLLVEAWGGKYQSQDISAKKGIGIEELLEKILLEAELLDLKANPNKRASGTVVEASLDKGRGYVSKMLVQAGTIKVGDFLIAGENAGRVKAMFNERGKKVESAGPSSPVLVLGLNGAPQAGELFKVMENESEAKEIANKRAQIVREQSARATKRISLDEIGRRLALGTFKELNLIIKGDVDGSVEALSDALLKQSHETVQVNVLHKAVGAISESDVTLASASDAIIIGFQVRPTPNSRKLAEREGVEIKLYSIIYEAIAEIRSAIEGMLEPTKEEKITSSIEVREVYKISKIGTVAGCYVQEGKAERKHFLRIIRDGIVVFPVKEGATATFGSLKRFKDDVKEVRSGFECGVTIDNYNDIQVGDFIETYEIIEVKQKLS